MKIGIQGGVGSFNEEAINYYTKQHNLKNAKIEYLYTTKKVLKELENKNVDLGQFAIHNSNGGVVWESVVAMGKYKFKVVNHVSIIIAHALMIGKHQDINQIDTIMTHPQVLKQCKNTLYNKYPHLTLTSGKGTMIDHAKVAQAISKQEIPNNIAVMGSKVLADIYNLNIIEDNLQDNKHNYTHFLVVKK